MKFDTSIAQTHWHSPLGLMIIAATDRGLAGAWFDDQGHVPDYAGWRTDDSAALLQQAIQELGEYFDGQRRSFSLALDLSAGTLFQQSVWHALLHIPAGQTTSYGNISRRIDKPKAVRAVGAAIGRNPLSIIVPCHRVLGADGSLTGYDGGLHRKTALLQLEGAL
jgi:methylated-DNA-[protein]-cysteine S-methyltransferase